MHEKVRVSLKTLLIFLVSAVGFSSTIFAEQTAAGVMLESPNWDRQMAARAVSMPDVKRTADRLLALVQGGKEAEALDELHALSAQTGQLQPEAEAAIYEFTQQLRTLPPFSVSQPVMDFLVHFQPRVLVQHEESMAMGVPLFPVRAAAAGVVNQWTREQAGSDALALIASRPSEVLRLYATNTDANIRAGIEDALDSASPASLGYLAELGLPLLEDYPGLTGLLGEAAVKARSVDSVSRVIAQGAGHQLTGLIRAVGQTFSSDESAFVLLAVLDSAPASTASLALAELAPYTLHQDAVAETLLSKLNDAALGSSAALALATWGNEDQRKALKARAESDPSGSTARRIQTALSLAASAQPAADG